jgi:hypothetical protein
MKATLVFRDDTLDVIDSPIGVIVGDDSYDDEEWAEAMVMIEEEFVYGESDHGTLGEFLRDRYSELLFLPINKFLGV